MKYDAVTPSMASMITELTAAGIGLRGIAKYLGVSESTLRIYAREDRSPKAVRMALFWITTAGRQFMNIDLANEAQVFGGWARSLERENKALQAAIQTLEAELRSAAKGGKGVFGTAINDKFFDARRVVAFQRNAMQHQRAESPTTYTLKITEIWEIPK